MTRNSPPKLGGEPARNAKREPDSAKPQKKSEQAGWFPCRYWQLREPPRPRLRSGTPPNLGGEWPHSNSFTSSMSARDVFFVQSRHFAEQGTGSQPVASACFLNWALLTKD